MMIFVAVMPTKFHGNVFLVLLDEAVLLDANCREYGHKRNTLIKTSSTGIILTARNFPCKRCTLFGKQRAE